MTTDFDWRTDTGPIDFFNPDDPLVAELISAQDEVVIDANGKHHGKSDGRFVSKVLEYPNLVKPEPEVRWIVKRHQQVPLETVSISCAQNSEQGTFSIVESVIVTGGYKRVTYSNGRVTFLRQPCRSEDDVIESGDPQFNELLNLSLETAPAAALKPKRVSPATIRTWGQVNGFLVGDRGKLPQSLIDAYHAANR